MQVEMVTSSIHFYRRLKVQLFSLLFSLNLVNIVSTGKILDTCVILHISMQALRHNIHRGTRGIGGIAIRRDLR